MSNPQIIAISNTDTLINDSNRILFRYHYYYKSIYKLYLVEYCENTKLKKIYLSGGFDLGNDECKLTLNDFPDLDENIKLYISEFIKKNPDYVSYINWGKYVVIYLSSGSVLVVSNNKIECELNDPECNYQNGDCSCKLFMLNNGDLLIVNDGDVCSCILLTINSPQLYVHDIVHDEDECSEYTDCNNCYICNTDQPDLTMKMLDGLDMKLVNDYKL